MNVLQSAIELRKYYVFCYITYMLYSRKYIHRTIIKLYLDVYQILYREILWVSEIMYIVINSEF